MKFDFTKLKQIKCVKEYAVEQKKEVFFTVQADLASSSSLADTEWINPVF